jgi:hypothetical protein
VLPMALSCTHGVTSWSSQLNWPRPFNRQRSNSNNRWSRQHSIEPKRPGNARTTTADGGNANLIDLVPGSRIVTVHFHQCKRTVFSPRTQPWS